MNVATSTPPKFRIDVSIHNLLMNAPTGAPAIPQPKGMTLPEPVFPQHPELLNDPGPETIPEKRDWTRGQIMRKVRGWLAEGAAPGAEESRIPDSQTVRLRIHGLLQHQYLPQQSPGREADHRIRASSSAGHRLSPERNSHARAGRPLHTLLREPDLHQAGRLARPR